MNIDSIWWKNVEIHPRHKITNLYMISYWVQSVGTEESLYHLKHPRCHRSTSPPQLFQNRIDSDLYLLDRISLVLVAWWIQIRNLKVFQSNTEFMIQINRGKKVFPNDEYLLKKDESGYMLKWALQVTILSYSEVVPKECSKKTFYNSKRKQ